MIKVPENKNNDKYNLSDNLTDGNNSGAAAPGTDVFFQQKGSFQHAARRNYKDSVFVDLFYTDETAGENLLSLYNALYDDSLTDIHALKGVRLEMYCICPLQTILLLRLNQKRLFWVSIRAH